RAEVRRRPAFLRGTFAPFLRASDRPIAIACLRLLTFLPLRPLFSLPRLRRRIADLTAFPAPLLYLAIAQPPLGGIRPFRAGVANTVLATHPTLLRRARV